MTNFKMDGIILIDKPIGWTSFDVVAKVRSQLRTEIRNQEIENSTESEKLIPNSSFKIPSSPKVKVGHTGTLDPLATGLLIIVTGTYCKRAQEFSKMDKWYQTEVTLGSTSTTDDDEGDKTKVSNNAPDIAEVMSVLDTFIGEQSQLPPAFSAIKIDGKRAYKLAREGKAVKMEPRTITIYELTDVTYDYPKLKFAVKVSSGTYIRSLARDIGEKLNTGAYMSGLVRTQVGPFMLSQAIKVEDFQQSKLQQP